MHQTSGTHHARSLSAAFGVIRSGLDRPGAAGLGAALLCVMAGAVLAAFAPVVLKWLLDDLYGEAGQAGFFLLVYAACLGLGRLTGEGRAFLFGRAEQALVRKISLQTFSHVILLPVTSHQDQSSGGLLQTIENGLQGYRLLLQHAVFTLLPGILEIALICGVLFHFFDGVFLAVFAACALAYGVVFTAGARGVLKSSRDVSAARIAAAGALTDSLLNIETIKAFCGERRMTDRMDARLSETRHHWRRFHRVRLLNGSLVALIFTSGLAVMLMLAVSGIKAGDMTPGDLILVSAYLLQVVRPMEALGSAARDLGQAAAFIERLNTVLAEPAEMAMPGAEITGSGEASPAGIRFETVSFSYPGSSNVLDDITLEIPPGTKVALVGPSGSGKSTLLRLVLKFHEPTEGRILLDGKPLSAMAPDAVRRRIAFIGQDTALFNDSLAFNIGFPCADRSPDDLSRAIALADLDRVAARHPNGISARVGERGAGLSGGERQLVAIARAVLRGAGLILADEPTSALDPVTEARVLARLGQASQGATTLICSHRLRPVMTADLILVMSEGRVIETGCHEALLARGGLYAKMWHIQLSGDRAGPGQED